MNIVIGIFVGSVVAIVSALFGKWLSRNSAKEAVELSFEKAEKLITKQELIKAAAEFEAAFTEEVILLEKPRASTRPEDSAQSIVEVAAVRNKKAMIKFRPHVIESKRSSFDKAWNDYKDANQYSTKAHDPEEQKVQRRNALKKIKKLLKLTK